MLGDPNIEFPRDGLLIQWYPGYEVALSNGSVIAVETIPVESDEERMARELSIRQDEKRLREASQALPQQEEISYVAWLDR